MRLALAFLLVVTAVVPARAQNNPQNSQEILRQRLLIQERVNKGWDIQAGNSRERIESNCKFEARKRYSALRPIKRRKFVKECIRRASR